MINVLLRVGGAAHDLDVGVRHTEYFRNKSNELTVSFTVHRSRLESDADSAIVKTGYFLMFCTRLDGHP